MVRVSDKNNPFQQRIEHADSKEPATMQDNVVSNSGSNRKIKYQQVKNILIQRIMSGEYPTGTYLPSESQLVKEFSVSRVTIRLALEEMQKMDLLNSRQGKGHMVKSMMARQDLGRLQGFGEIMAPLGVETRSKILSVEQIIAPPNVAEGLGLKPKSEVIKTIRLRIAANINMSMDVSYFPLDIGQHLIGLDLENNDVFHLLETELGIEISYADIIMDLVNPSEFVSEHLATPMDDHVLRIERITYDLRFRPIDFEYIYGQPETQQFKVRLPRW